MSNSIRFDHHPKFLVSSVKFHRLKNPKDFHFTGPCPLKILSSQLVQKACHWLPLRSALVEIAHQHFPEPLLSCHFIDNRYTEVQAPRKP